MNPQARIAQLEQQVAELTAECDEWRRYARDERVAQLAYTRVMKTVVALGIRKSHARLLLGLLDASPRPIRKGQLLELRERSEIEVEDPDWKIEQVYICEIRKGLRRAGVERPAITTLWGLGYVITAEQKAMILAAAPEIAA